MSQPVSRLFSTKQRLFGTQQIAPPQGAAGPETGFLQEKKKKAPEKPLHIVICAVKYYHLLKEVCKADEYRSL
jgi:hypothetical protein